MANEKAKNNNKNKNSKDLKRDFKKERQSRESQERPKWHEDLRQETKHSILAVISFVISLIFILTVFGKSGMLGNLVFRAFDFLFGAGFYLLPILFLSLGVSFLISFRARILAVNLIGGGLFLGGALGLIETIFQDRNGGYFGYLISLLLLKLFDAWVTLILLSAVLVVSILMIFNISLRLKKKEETEDSKKLEEASIIPQIANVFNGGAEQQDTENKKELHETVSKPVEKEVHEERFAIFKNRKNVAAEVGLPPTDLLYGDKGKPTFGDVKANSNIIKRTLQNFGIEVEMGEVSIGPSVTQFTLKPAEGVKLVKITALSNDLSLALAVHPLRIEAPIPGKSLVGIEVPNKSTSLVGLRSLIENPDFKESLVPLMLALGRNVAGHTVYADLTKMPHLLIAGSTGSGKSVAIHALIMSLLYKNTSKNLRFLMVDPKRVELNAYSAIPHLLAPAITDAKKTIMALRWAVKEMEKRYEILFSKKVRDIKSYRELMEKEGKDHEMPYIVIIIDELADIMAVYPRELEASIVRLAQMSRAVGIHLIVSTQRPSVEVITGLIKANITSRIAFQVASQIDSRTILDASGSEKLLGNGDMLFLSGDASKPRRIQGAFVSDEEVKRVAAYLENECPPELSETELDLNDKAPEEDREGFSRGSDMTLDFDGMEGEADDDLYVEAKQVVIEAGKASASYLQRRLKIGYARAARLLDVLEDKGVIGPGDGAKPREVYVSKNQE